ncbi:MAG: hypothetical protein R3D98_17605 [Candidatus Krumholzibacteriia bacterium]
MPALNRLYNGLPVAMQNLAVSLAGWSARRRRFDRRFQELLAAAERRVDAGPDALAAYRDQRVRGYVMHCAATVPYWRRQFARLQIDPREIRGLADLTALPVLTKVEVKEHRDEFYSDAWPARRCEARGTGGTTGASLRFRATPDAVREQWAVWWRYWRWHGIPLHQWCGYFVGIDVVPTAADAPYWRENRSRRQRMFSIFHLRPDTLDQYVAELTRHPLPWLHGYPSVLAILASHLLATGTRLATPPRWITTGAENLLPHQVDLIERAFGPRPRQHYGLAEGVANLSECEHGRLHVDEDFAAVEFLRRDDGATALVGTNLANPAFCLLRYDTGDLVETLPDSQCPCGRPGRLAARIDGRLEDAVLLPDGTRLGRLAHIFQHLDCLREAQVHQHADGRITLRIAPRPGFGEPESQAVLAAARRRLGPSIPLTIELVDRIVRGPNGKLRFVVSELTRSTAAIQEDRS